MSYVVEMLNIRKEFPVIVANDNITLQLKKGEIHALLGENGAGKSTLMGMLFGMYSPDKGIIKIKGKEVKISDLNSFDTILNNVGRFHDYYIPQIDGQKTVDIDSTPGQQVDTDDQLLEDLRKDMISGMGIPASLTF